MQIETMRFGTLEIEEKKILRFTEGLPGLESCREFAILQFAESGPVHWLQSVRDPEICLPIVSSFAIVKDYAFDISEEDVAHLGLESAEDVYIVSVVVIPENNIEQMTANMIAPIIINHRTGAAKQVIISNSEYSVRYPIFSAICNLLKEGDADAGAITQDK